MFKSVKKGMQAAALWLSVLLIVVVVWPPALKLPALWMVIGVSVLANVLQPAYNPFKGSRTKEDRGTAVQILWTVYLTQAIALTELVWRKPASVPLDGLAWLAFVGMLGGLALRTWSVVLLGRWFTWNVTVQPGQELITRGPYRFIRHPSYTGALITFVASCVLLRSWIAACVAAVSLTAAFMRRIRYEEALLNEKLTAYPAYRNRTGRLFPRLLRVELDRPRDQGKYASTVL